MDERSRRLTEDLSDAGVELLSESYQSIELQTLHPQTETQIERELKLKIQLAELELEREKLQHHQSSNPFPATNIKQVGVQDWQVIPWTQKTMFWASWTDATRLLHELGYGYKTENWFKLRILGELWVMPANSFDAQKAAVEQFKFERN